MTISSSNLLSITACTLFWGLSAGAADDSVCLKHHALVIAAKGGDRIRSDEVSSLVVAALNKRFNVSDRDLLHGARPVLRHRVLLNYHAEADRRSVDSIIKEVVTSVR